MDQLSQWKPILHNGNHDTRTVINAFCISVGQLTAVQNGRHQSKYSVCAYSLSLANKLRTSNDKSKRANSEKKTRTLASLQHYFFNKKRKKRVHSTYHHMRRDEFQHINNLQDRNISNIQWANYSLIE